MFKMLNETLEAYQRRDPAARSKLEILLLYQGVHAVLYHRVAHWLYCKNWRFLARCVSQWSRFWTGIEIHPGAKIGRRLVIDHGMGIVIGETAEVGDDCLIYHGVTLGGTGKDQGKRHPTIGNNVLISCGAKVLGPFKVGDNSRIAANAVVLSEVPDDATAVGIPAQIVRIAGRTTHFADDVDQTSVENPTLEKLAALADRVEQLERQLASHKVDGVILSRTMSDDPSIDLLQQYGVPFVAIGRIENDDIPQADNDQLGAASEMTRVLFQMGARRIAYLGGSGTYTVNADRLRGYLRGLAEFGVPADQSLIRTGIESDEQRTDALEAVLEQHPDCLLCCDDRIAFDLMRELRNRHIRVPEQLRLASLYDSELLAGTTPAISAVQFDAERLGSTACRMLLDVMAGKDIPLRQVQGYQVILRESTK